MILHSISKLIKKPPSLAPLYREVWVWNLSCFFPVCVGQISFSSSVLKNEDPWTNFCSFFFLISSGTILLLKSQFYSAYSVLNTNSPVSSSRRPEAAPTCDRHQHNRHGKQAETWQHLSHSSGGEAVPGPKKASRYQGRVARHEASPSSLLLRTGLCFGPRSALGCLPLLTLEGQGSPRRAACMQGTAAAAATTSASRQRDLHRQCLEVVHLESPNSQALLLTEKPLTIKKGGHKIWH